MSMQVKWTGSNHLFGSVAPAVTDVIEARFDSWTAEV